MAFTYIFLASCLAAYVVAMPSLESGNLGSFSDCPPNNPFCPVWIPCNFTVNQGPYCQDCTTKVVCTPVGGLVLPCQFPGVTNCVDGECSSEPSEECSSTTSEDTPPRTDMPETETQTPSPPGAEDWAYMSVPLVPPVPVK